MRARPSQFNYKALKFHEDGEVKQIEECKVMDGIDSCIQMNDLYVPKDPLED